MRLNAPELEVSPDSPFENDTLDRRQSAEILTQILQNTSHPLVLAIDAQWGGGKSTFLRMWGSSLRSQGFGVVSFNAWRNDFASDPIVAFLSEMKTALEGERGSGEFERSVGELVTGLKEAGTSLLRKLLPVGVRLLTAGVVSGTEFDLEKLEDALGDYIADEVARFESTKNEIEEFRQQLLRLAKILGQNSGHATPIVFLVDELDRCMPTYAVSLLERLKHIFSVEGVAFVLAIDHGQLCASIRGAYGGGIDAERYLRRFIDLTYQLPNSGLQSHVRALFGRFSLRDEEEISHACLRGADKEAFEEAFSFLAGIYGCSLRDIEQAFGTLSLLLRMTAKQEAIDGVVLAMALALYVSDRNGFMQFRVRQMAIEQYLQPMRNAILELGNANFFVVKIWGLANLYFQGDEYINSLTVGRSKYEELKRTGGTVNEPEPSVKMSWLSSDTIRGWTSLELRSLMERISKRLHATDSFK